MKIVFLHIPKTAGQSVHHFFQTTFDKNEICPARVNSQLKNLTCEDLNKYKIFSGHLDWNKLECLTGENYTFTILRDPKERILSFYFYLRSQALKLSEVDLKKPEHQGMKAALNMTPDEYFCEAEGHIRTFLDNHYDNFYMYYFAGKTYNSREKLISKSREEVCELALKNLNSLDKVYSISSWEDLYSDLQKIYPNILVPEKKIHINKGNGLNFESRYKELINLGASNKTFTAIEEFCKYDNVIYKKYSEEV